MKNLDEIETSRPLPLYWWDGEPNFGDILSKHVVEYVANRPVIYSKPVDCELFSLGSIMRQVRRSCSEPANKKKPWIWGTGSKGSQRNDFIRNVRIKLVRGPLTATLLGIKVAEYGDPGLLISELIDAPIETSKRIGLVPHHSQVNSTHVQDALKKSPRLQLIDVRNEDALAVAREISSCEYVLSSSLHGLIVADSFGVPNTWLNPDGIHQMPRFKFYDYALSVKRLLAGPINYVDIPEYIENLQPKPISYSEGITSSKQALLRTFPKELVNSQ